MGRTREQTALKKYADAQAILQEFEPITKTWAVNTGSKFQQRISNIKLIASGDLESDWSVKVVTIEGGILVADFTFPEYGRIWDMRHPDFNNPAPAAEIEAWVKDKVAQNRIKYSTLATRLGVSFSDPRVIHDLTYRMRRTDRFKHPRRRWYNKGKEASLGDLYDLLAEALSKSTLAGVKESLS